MLNPVGEELKKEFRENEEMCAHIIDLFQLISNKHRFRIVCILSRGDFCVTEIAEILGTDKLSNLSQQLKILRLAGIISSHREEKNMIYRLSDERMRRIIAFLREQNLQGKGA